MKTRILKFVLFITVIFTFVISYGCFKKDVMVDTADDVEEVLIMDAGGEKVLVTREEIYQATSKESGRGITRTTGYTEYRLSSYNLNTGELIKRVDLGERDDNNHFLLGPADGKLWYISSDKEIGLHARDPKTLEIIVPQSEILNKNPELTDNLPHPQHYEYRRYYGYDNSLKMPMISDNSGFVYYLDPKTLKTDKTDKSIETFKYDESAKTTSMEFNSDTYLNLSGEPRKILRIKSKDYPEFSFLDGDFMFSTTKYSLSETNPEFFEPINKEIEKYRRDIDSLNKLLEEYKNSGVNESDYRIRSVGYSIESAQRDIKRKEDEIKRKDTQNGVLITEDRGVFIMHKSNATDTAKVIISKILIDENLKPEKKWETILQNVFYDPGKVISNSGFEYVFSKGNPDLSTVRIIYSEGKLVYIFMMRCVCIDEKTGKILWDIEL